MQELKSAIDPIVKCIQVPFRTYDDNHPPKILYSPAGASLIAHIDHPHETHENFDINSTEGHEWGRRAALSIPLNYGVEEDPTVFYDPSDMTKEVARCYYERNGVYLINTYAPHGTNTLKYERYTFQVSFDLDMFSPLTDLDNILDPNTPGSPIYLK